MESVPIGRLRTGYVITTAFLSIGIVLGIGTGQGAQAQEAQPADFTLQLEHFPPDTFRDVETDLGNIEGDISQAECGGWDFEMSADDKIPRVEGAPGRDAEPFGYLTLGMGKRDEEDGLLEDGFLFPNTQKVWGWTSACRPGNPPYYRENTPCQNTEKCAEMYGRINRWQRPVWSCMEWKRDGWTDEGEQIWWADVRIVYGDCRERRKNDNDPHREPQWPNELNECDSVAFQGWQYCCTHGWVSELDYEDCNENENTERECLDHPDYGRGNIWWHVFVTQDALAPWGEWNEVQFERDKTRNALRCEGDGAKVDEPDPVDFNRERLERGNDRIETGCRVGRGPAEVGMPQPDFRENPQGEKELIPRQFISYYRHYNTSYERADIRQYVPQDRSEMQNLPVECFGLYFEFDPKKLTTINDDYRCLINMEHHEDQFDSLRDTQEGKAHYGEELDLPDTPFWDAPLPPTPPHTAFPPTGERPFPFGGKSLWANDFHNVVADGSNTVDNAEGRMEPGFLNLETMEHHPIVQMTVEEPRSTGSLIRAFDDTVADMNQKRSVVEWWQKTQTEMYKHFTPPKLRLLLPTAWSLGLDPDDPFFSPEPLEKITEEWTEDPLLQSIEVQLEVRDDLLGEIAKYIVNSTLLQAEQEDMAIVVPLASPTELRAIKEGWCHWYKYQNKTGDCENVDDQDLQDLLEKIEEYAVRIDEYRKLRAELSLYIKKYMDIRHETIGHVADWYKRHIELFMEYEQTKQALSAQMATWADDQRLHRILDQEINMPWCMNTRFTTPIYSLLDPWLEMWAGNGGDVQVPDEDQGDPDRIVLDYGPRRERENLSGALIPPFDGLGESPDGVLDLSHLSTSTGVLKIPVLQPVQVQYDMQLLTPPSPYEQNASIPKLPDLPPIPSLIEELGEEIVNFEAEESAQIGVCSVGEYRFGGSCALDTGGGDPTPWEMEPNTPTEHFTEYEEVIKKMLNGMIASYSRLWRSVQRALDNDNCPGFNQDRCRHVEMDLRERLTRIGSRPMILLKEDFQSHGQFRVSAGGPTDCPTEDWACQFLRPEHTFARRSMHMEIAGDQQEQMDRLRTKVLQKTIQTMSFPMKTSPLGVFPSLDFPPAIPLYE